MIINCMFVCVLVVWLSSSINLGEEEENILREILKEFDSNPKHGRYDRMLCTSFLFAKNVPKVIIWCPIRHNSISVKCPLHSCPLRVGHWTDVLNVEKPCPRNPRLIYNLHGNALLVQSFYECSLNIPGNKMRCHRYLSASNEILNILPRDIRAAFHVILQQRSGFTLQLHDYVISSIYQGQNFMELSDGISSLNFREFVRNNPHITDYEGRFQSSIFCASPSNNKLMDLFLMHYDQNKKLYDRNMHKKTATILTFDHTFKTAKYIGVTRDEGKFVRQFENVYLAVNEKGEVLAWRYTKSTSAGEILDLLKDLKKRLDAQDAIIDMIIFDDCCHVANLYQSVFANVKIKLDLFHACARVVQTVSKSSHHFKAFTREFPLIFRQDGDLDHERTMPTPGSEDIEGNLERLLFSWGEKLGQETHHQIENLRNHIRKGCLSDIPPGCGTEMNERSHRHLNRAMLCGVARIGPELAIAIMACCLYAWNCKRQTSFHRNRSVTVPPIDIEGRNQQTEFEPVMPDINHMKKASIPVDTAKTYNTSSSDGHNSLKLEQLQKEPFFNFIVQRTLHLQEFISTFHDRCKNKVIDILRLLWSSEGNTTLLVADEMEINTIGIDMSGQHSEDLQRNLSSLNLEIDAVAKDGNCFFTAVAKQLMKHLPKLEKEAINHIRQLWLGNTVEEDSKKLRVLFVEEIKGNLDSYREWIQSDGEDTHLQNDIERFLSDGHFASHIGDICTKAISTVLRIPLIVVTAFTRSPTIPFIPQQRFASTDPMFIAYDHSALAIMMLQMNVQDQFITKTLKLQTYDARAGKITRNKKANRRASRLGVLATEMESRAQENAGVKGAKGVKNENNETNITRKVHFKAYVQNRGCSCGRANNSTLSCKDGDRKSKSPCVIREAGCTDSCRCHNCANIVQTGGVTANRPPSKRSRETLSPYKRKKSDQFMKDGAQVTTGPWRDLETLCLIVCKEVLSAHRILANSVNLKVMYNFVARSNLLKCVSLPLNEKSTAQVAAKMSNLER